MISTQCAITYSIDLEVFMKSVLLAVLALQISTVFADHEISYLAKTKNGEFICIDSDFNTERPYQSFRFFKGQLNSFREFPVQNVIRKRDGGTTYVTLKDSRIYYSPSFLKKNESASFNNQEVQELEILFTEGTNCLSKLKVDLY